MSVAGLFVGLATLDVVQQVDRPPAPNEKLVARETWLAAGGPAAVAAIAFAALGGRARLWTALGSSPAARLVAADLADAGVEVVDVAPPGFELAASTVLLDTSSGQRAVVSGSGRVPVLGRIAGPDLAGLDVVLVDGHHPTLARMAVLSALTTEPRVTAVGGPGEGGPGGNGRVPVVVDAGSHKPGFDDILALATDVICSADYVHPDGLAGPDLLDLGLRLVAVSHGGEPLAWWTPAATGSIPPGSGPVVDTVGAGDVLHGAYCHGLASGLGRVPALERAVAVASERVRHRGPFAWRAAVGVRWRGRGTR